MSRPTPVIAALAALLAGPMFGGAPPAAAQDARTQSWSEVKCARYQKAWTDTLARRGRRGLGEEFIRSHEAFLAGGCTGRGEVCPRSGEELEVANILTIAAMNAGTASTFLPFACRR